MLINRSFLEGIFPKELKLARVIPIFKSGDKSLITNYRPISVLSFFSKIFEKIMYNNLYAFVEDFDIIYAHQYGFRKGHSTQQAIITLVDKITRSVNNGDVVIGMFLDLKKAFDTVDHKILLKKLEAYGIRGHILDWFASYLTGRSQYVSFDGIHSKKRNVLCGVPQGSILGPLLFIIYVNDIFNVSHLLSFVLYADDTSVLIKGKHVEELISTLIKSLILLTRWLNANKLSLNVEKTYYMMFH